MSLTWETALKHEKQQPYFLNILKQVKQQRNEGERIYPNDLDLFSAFDSTPLDKVKVVILGQDPYHGNGQAHGLAFSVLPGIKTPPSLANMYKELVQDIDGFEIPNHGYLQSWAEQGVLLLNTVLTVKEAQAHSHKTLGWETFTDKVIKVLNQEKTGLVFLLWGAHAQKKAKGIDAEKHHILHAPHPSPLSAHRGFLGCKHFSAANQVIEQQGQSAINWHVPKELESSTTISSCSGPLD